MSKIIITTDDQNLLFTEMPDIFSGDVNYDEVEFVFDETWDNMSRTAVFFTRETSDKPIGVFVGVSNTVKIPSELMTEKCTLYIGLYGVVDGTTIKTSQIVQYDIGKGSPVNTQEMEAIEETYWEQVMGAVGDMQQSVTDVNNELKTIKESLEVATVSEVKSYLGIS